MAYLHENEIKKLINKELMLVRELEVKKLINSELMLVRELIKDKPEVDSKLACKMIGCERTWLSKNAHLFGGRVINKRGERRFDTLKILEYKRQGAEKLNINQPKI